MLLDSNIIIYAAQAEHVTLRQFIAEHTPAVSVISYIEALGYHRLSAEERQFLERFFQATEVLPVSDAVVQWAIRLRQRRRMTLGDAIVAGTAVEHGRVLVTHNTEDFLWISELKLLDPLAGHP
ncbi:MAG TPA: type II toxin-antitoxin system VapC family toxin [Terriglobia bacterium]|nr:type II toxin-antitoxin system VapC family toxin [Terriglobia bacterium]